jgi:hypothetical protein
MKSENYKGYFLRDFMGINGSLWDFFREKLNIRKLVDFF